MKYIAILLTLLFLSIYMIVYALNDIPLVHFEDIVVCQSEPLTFSGSDVRITEISFDGNDERVEITNIGNQDFSGTITLSGVKSTPISYHIQIPSKVSLVLGDSLSSLTGDIATSTGQGFSISDTTGFTISLLINGLNTHQYPFSKTTITQIPNTFGLEAIRSGNDFSWMQTSITTNYNTIPPIIANPGVVFCSPELEIITDDPVPEYTGGDIGFSTGDTYTGADSGDGSGYDEIPDIELPPEDSTEDEPTEDTTPIPQDTGSYIPPFVPKELPCTISEIHSSTDIYPEYVELLCSTPFSGTIKTMGIGVGETNKDILIHTNGGYWTISSTTTGLLTSFNTSLITSMSLRDAGESLTFSLSGYITGSISFPDIPPGKSYYPLCGVSGCIGLPSPGFSELYLSGFIFGPITAPVTTPTTNSSYYQDLYNKWKATAESYKTENSALKKEQTSIKKELTTLQKKTQTTATTKKTTSKTTTKAAAVKVTTPKATKTATTKTTTTKKAPTVSTTSKAYVKLVDEHKLYKNYITFIDSYLKSHLYTQYSSLGLAKVQSLLTNSLKAISKQSYILPFSGSTTGISVFDFAHQLGQNTLTVDTLYISLFHHYSTFFSSLSNSLSGIFLAKDISKDKLIEGKNLSKNDTGNDIMDTKISEMSFSLLE